MTIILKTTLLLSALLPVIGQCYVDSLPKHRAQIKPVQESKLPTKPGHNMYALVHKIGLVGEESGRIVSSNPDDLEAQMAETTGDASACGKGVGHLNLVEHNGKHYLIGNAHGFYANGVLICNESEGFFYPDLHYSKNTPGINRKRKYAFKLPPLNHKTALKRSIDKTNPKNINDFVVLEIKDQSLLKSQTGKDRKVIKMAAVEDSKLKNLAQTYDLTIIAKRTNFENYRKASFEKGCQINNYINTDDSVSKLKKHSCDTGGGASGSSLNFLDEDHNIYSVGIHYGGIDATVDEFENEKSLKGNFFIPASQVIKVLDEIQNNSEQPNAKIHNPEQDNLQESKTESAPQNNSQDH